MNTTTDGQVTGQEHRALRPRFGRGGWRVVALAGAVMVGPGAGLGAADRPIVHEVQDLFGHVIAREELDSTGRRHGTTTYLTNDGATIATVIYRAGEARAASWPAASTGGAAVSVTWPHARAELDAAVKRGWPAPIEPLAWTTAPNARPPYVIGVLDAKAQLQAVEFLRLVRWCGGVPNEALAYDPALSLQAQHAAVALDALGLLTHTPDRPAGMDDAMFAVAKDACGNCNLTGGIGTDLPTAVMLFVSDSDPGNRDRVGHRRWALNPAMTRTGFGASGRMMTMWAVNGGIIAGWQHSTWPGSGLQPVELYHAGEVWSVQLCRPVWQTPVQSSISIRVRSVADDFHLGPAVTVSDLAVADHPGMPSTVVVFAPDVTPTAGERWLVEVDGLRMKGGAARSIAWITEFVRTRDPAADAASTPARPAPVAVDHAPAAASPAAPVATAPRPAAAPAEPIAAQPSVPSPDDFALLDRVNRFRADPKAEGERYLPRAGMHLPGVGSEVDWPMFAAEMAAIPPAPPLLIDPVLTTSARNSADYLVRNQTLSHIEMPGLPGFTGETVGDRAKAVGWRGPAVAENAVRLAFGLDNLHAGYLIDQGTGPGAMQIGRGHRMTLANPAWMLIGMGTQRHVALDAEGQQRTCNVQHFAFRRDIARVVGGVVWEDRDGNGLYDPGEGVDGASISITADGGAVDAVTPWTGGGWSAPRPDTAAVTVSITVATRTRTWTVAAGTANAYLRWRVPSLAERTAIAALTAEMQQAKGTAVAHVARAIAGHLIVLDPDDPDLTTIAAEPAVVTALTALRQARAEVLTQTNAGAFRKAVSAAKQGRRDWKDTAAEVWFTDADTALATIEPVAALMTVVRARRPIEVGRTGRTKDLIGPTRAKLTTGDWFEWMTWCEDALNTIRLRAP